MGNMASFIQQQLLKMQRQRDFDREFYVDVATGRTKRRLYVNKKSRARFDKKKEVEDNG